MWIYAKNDFYMPRLWTIINLTIVIIIIASSLIISFFVDRFAIFSGFSLSTWIFALLLFVYSCSEIGSDYAKLEKIPVYFSPWIFPVYIYSPKKNDVEVRNFPSICLLLGFLVMIAWSVLASIWVYPYHVGVSASILFELLMSIAVLFLVSISNYQLKEVVQDIDKKIIRRAWNETKLSYVTGRGALNREQLLTYDKVLLRRDYFRNYMRVKEGRTELNMEEKIEGVTLIDEDAVDMEWVDENQVNLQN